jgi:Ser/Thr protein kinase RdoA (MazF antagonist)
MDPIAAISAAQPTFSTAAAEQALAANFGLRGALQPLLSERDQNFRVTTDDDRVFVFKIANHTESPVTTDFQIRALLHVEQQHCPVRTPVIQRTVAGDVSVQLFAGEIAHVSYVPGELLSAVDTSPQLAANLGRSAAQLDLALAGFAHAGENQSLMWDMQRAERLRDLLQFIADTELRARVGRCIDDFVQRAKPLLPELRCQIIHADLHGDNVLVDAANNDAVAGVIDFGDMLRGPIIMEVAIAAAYLRSLEGDALRLIAPFVAGFNQVIPLHAVEIELLFDLVRARLAATISILRWRAAKRGTADKYSRDYMQSERSAETFLGRLDALGRDAFSARMRSACGH